MSPVMLAFVVTIVIVLIAAVIFIGARQAKVVPKASEPRPASQIGPPAHPQTTMFHVVRT
jgi:hypothetical protein